MGPRGPVSLVLRPSHAGPGTLCAMIHPRFSIPRSRAAGQVRARRPDDFLVRLALLRGCSNRDEKLPGPDAEHAILPGVRLCLHAEQHLAIAYCIERRLVHASPHLEAYPIASARPLRDDDVGTSRQRNTNFGKLRAGRDTTAIDGHAHVPVVPCRDGHGDCLRSCTQRFVQVKNLAVHREDDPHGLPVRQAGCQGAARPG